MRKPSSAAELKRKQTTAVVLLGVIGAEFGQDTSERRHEERRKSSIAEGFNINNNLARLTSKWKACGRKSEEGFSDGGLCFRYGSGSSAVGSAFFKVAGSHSASQGRHRSYRKRFYRLGTLPGSQQNSAGLVGTLLRGGQTRAQVLHLKTVCSIIGV